MTARKKQTPALESPPIDFEADAPANTEPEGDALKRLAQMAGQLLEAQYEGARIDAELVAKEAEIRRLAEEDIPNLLKECGLSEIKLEDGTRVLVSEELECSIGPQEDPVRRSKALGWLVDNRLGGIIKTGVVVPFGKDSEAEVNELREKLNELGYVAELEQDVHWQTLRSTLRAERQRRAELRAKRKNPDAPLTPAEQKVMGDIPEDVFGLRAFAKASLKLPDGVQKPEKIRKRK